MSACSRRKLVPPTNMCPDPDRSENLSVIPEFISHEVGHGHRGLSVTECGQVQRADVAGRQRLEGNSVGATEPISTVKLLSRLLPMNFGIEPLPASQLRDKGLVAVQHAILVHLLILAMGLPTEIQQRESTGMLV